MRALILAAGLGTRLKPITLSVPKCMVPILGRPLLEHWLRFLFGGGVERVLVNTHYLPDSVMKLCQKSEWSSSIDLRHEEILLGTAGTVIKNKQFFHGTDFAVIHADNLTCFSWNEFKTAHLNRPKECVMTMMTFRTDSPSSCGILSLDERGVVVDFFEKVDNPPGNLANGAVYLFSPEIFNYLDAISDISTELIPQLMGKIFTYENTIYHRDIGSLESYHQALEDFKKRNYFLEASL